MSHFCGKNSLLLCVIGQVILYSLSFASLTQGQQIISDGTLSTKVTLDGQDFTITDGTQAGKNLFHSFSEFSIPTGRVAHFNNISSIENIITRVTGRFSYIDGVIKTNFAANLFLINPKGIVFGPNATLNVGGSFIATTASQINFADGRIFSATDLNTTPLLTTSIPIGLQIRETPGNIINRANSATGLNVPSGKTLALLGGDILLEGGVIFVKEGRIELGSVDGPALVSLTAIPSGWVLGYDNVHNYQNIQLSQEGSIQAVVLGNRADVFLKARNIDLVENSSIINFNFGDAEPSGMIAINASESLEVSEDSNIRTRAFLGGASGEILIKTRNLVVRDNSSFIDAATEGNGRGGNIIINAAESVEVDGGGGQTQISNQSIGNGNAGILKITTERLVLRNGGQLSSTTQSSGSGGAVNIEASELIEISGQGIGFDDPVAPSGIFARTSGEDAKGNGGAINIITNRLFVNNGGLISVAAVKGSTGRAGNITINANSLSLNQGTITAETGKTGGEEGANITLKISELLKIENESQISARANGSADGGNIDIDTPLLLVFPPTGSDGSDIIANAEEGNGGNITINSQGIFGIEEREESEGNQSNDIDASSEFGASGQVEIDNTIDPNRGLIELPETVVDPNALVAQNPCKLGSESEFVITGRGGLPPSLSEDLSSEATQVGLVEPAPIEAEELEEQRSRGAGDKTSSSPSVPTTIIPAQGWVFNERGEVVLVAYDPTVTGFQRLRSNREGCSTSPR